MLHPSGIRRGTCLSSIGSPQMLYSPDISMCGIVGYIGPKPVVPGLLKGLRQLEYRGYDSAGLAVVDGGEIAARRSSGKLAARTRAPGHDALGGGSATGPPRWATDGRPA